MIRIGILGDIGSGKSYVANNFGYPVFNADHEVSKLYKKDIKVFNRLQKILPKYFHSFPINKKEVSNAILGGKRNLNKIIKIVHLEIGKKMNIFLKKHKNKKIIILDIPLLLENKINKKNDVLVFVHSKKLDILKKLKKRDNFNQKLLNIFKNVQLPLEYKKNKSQFIIKNNFTKKSVRLGIQDILKKII
jgi:dephospho-CoA kinase